MRKITLSQTIEDTAMAEYVRGLADSSSGIIYVYPFMSNIKRTFSSRITIQNVKRSRKYNIGKLKALTGRKISDTSPNKKWAIRVEGKSKPLTKTFRSKEAATEHAQKMLIRGVGKAIKISN